jgi:hypothetical protein
MEKSAGPQLNQVRDKINTNFVKNKIKWNLK